MKALIIVDDLNIGGIQRLALDQAYQLVDDGVDCKILVLSAKPVFESATFETSERDLIASKKLNIRHISGNRKIQAFQMHRYLKIQTPSVVLCHSLRGGVLAFILRPILSSQYLISTTIHQLPSFSRKFQRLKRMLYSQFTDNLFIYSSAALKDWEFERCGNFLARLISFRRKPKLCRNGVYLPRLLIDKNKLPITHERKRLVYIGRLTTWKGLKTFLEIAALDALEEYEILLVVPSDPTNFFGDLSEKIKERISYTVGKSVNSISFHKDDIHLYPVVNNSRFIESISINVLEMACLGVPSLVTQNGLETWPELSTFCAVREVQWLKIIEVIEAIRKLEGSSLVQDLSKIHNLLDIKQNLRILLNN
jgi:glycosyltransferase involved in cell wall biosynthesis